MKSYKKLSVIAVLAIAAAATSTAWASGPTVLYSEGFESFGLGDHPAIWGSIGGTVGSVVTNEWAATGTQSLVATVDDGAAIGRPVIVLADVAASPLPDVFEYQATIHMEATADSSGIVGFFFLDPRDTDVIASANAVSFGLDGNVVWTGPTPQVIGTWTPGTATTATVRVVINFLSRKADVFLDGTLAGEDVDAWPRVIPATSVFGAEVTLDKWGFGLADGFAGAGPGRVFIDDVSLIEPEVIAATVKMTPRTLNLKSRGRSVSVFISLPQGVDPHGIDISSIFLVFDDSTPVFARKKPSSISNGGKKGVPRLMVKLPRSAVEAILSTGEPVTITIGGELEEGTFFVGSDSIKVINPGKGQGGNGNGQGNGQGG